MINRKKFNAAVSTTVVTTKFKSTTIKAKVKPSASLQSLMVAALALPGLIAAPAYAEDDEVSFQYGHYQEGKRDLVDVKSQLNPIEVDTIQGNAKIKLADRIKFAFNYTQDTWSGATPVATAPLIRLGNSPNISGASPKIEAVRGVFDKNYNPVQLSNPLDIASPVLGKNTQLVHTMTFASPETRKQGDFKLNYDWDNAAVNIGGGLSVERDYDSRFGSLGGRWDFNRKLTSVNVNLSYTNSYTHALMDYDSLSYFAFNGFYPFSSNANNNMVTGSREDWATHLGLTQILNKDAYINFSVGYTNSSGFLTNPYKGVTVAFIDPQSKRPDGTYLGQYAVLHEKRPDYRNQWTQSLSYVQHVAPLDAALHVDYNFFHDDWGINAHTFDVNWGQPLGNGWTITPRFRYYSQTAADFYQPVVISKHGLPGGPILNPDGTTNGSYPDAIKSGYLPRYFSSDQRLSGYGTLSGGVTVSKQFAKGLSLQASFEYYTHAGSLKLGGGGEGAYADFNYYVANAALNVDLAKLAAAGGGSDHHSEHNHHKHRSHNHQAPAGIMFDHALHKAGDIMVGYRYMYSDQSGSVLHGDSVAKNSDIIYHGCANNTCSSAPTFMTMHMHMLDLMYAPTDWLTLMLMPQFVDMDMDMYSLPGAPIDPNAHIHVGGHATGGMGDTGIYAIGKLFDKPGHHINLSLGVTAPTGDVNVMLRNTHQQGDKLIHYGMQLGSGTWDFKPSLTYTGERDDWSWGAQISGTKRLESINASAFGFGDIFQSTAWSGYNITPWLSASIRGVYTVQGTIKGEYTAAHPTDGPYDHPNNYGGRFGDVGFGLSAVIPNGDLQGNRLGFEWLQPVYTDFNGYQVDRNGALSATWSYMF